MGRDPRQESVTLGERHRGILDARWPGSRANAIREAILAQEPATQVKRNWPPKTALSVFVGVGQLGLVVISLKAARPVVCLARTIPFASKDPREDAGTVAYDVRGVVDSHSPDAAYLLDPKHIRSAKTRGIWGVAYGIFATLHIPVVTMQPDQLGVIPPWSSSVSEWRSVLEEEELVEASRLILGGPRD